MAQNVRLEPIQQPGTYNPYTILNQNRSVKHCDIDFEKIHENYVSLDPRTFDSPRAQRLTFDVPPFQSYGTQPQQNVYDLKTNHIGYYKNYESINGGDIIYYTDLDNDEPNGGPQFFIPAYTLPEILVDPMGSVKPYYIRVPMFQKNNNLYEYSFDQDQCEFREDLIALQQQGSNTSNFGAYQWFNNPKQYYPSYQQNSNGKFPLFQ